MLVKNHLYNQYLALKTKIAIIMMTVLLSMMTITTNGTDYGYGHHQPSNVNVINRQISLATITTAPDTAVQAALDLQWQAITEMIPIPGRIQQRNLFYNHTFRQNIGNYTIPERQQFNRSVQTRTVTKTYTGYIKQGFRIESNGSITFSH